MDVVHFNGFLERDALNNFVDALSNDFVGAILNDFGCLCRCRTAGCRVVFDAAVSRRIVRRRDNDTVSLFSLFALVIVRENDSAYDGSRDGFEVFLQNDVDTVCRENFNARTKCGLGKCVSVCADVQRTLNLFGGAIFVNRLRNGKNVLLVEAAEFGAAAMSACAERNALRLIFRVRRESVVIAYQGRKVDNVFTHNESSFD